MTGKLVELLLILRKLQNTEGAVLATEAVGMLKTIAGQVDKLEQENADYRHKLATIRQAFDAG